METIIKEITINVPWGQIAAKCWGDEKDKIVLVFHGVMDNAGSFDNLIPLLPKSFYYVCVDLPSHGKSSHFPPHLPIYTLNFLIVYKHVMEHFRQKSYIVMGHSYGGQIGFLFAQIYPEKIEKLILLDTINIFPVLPAQFRDILSEKIETHIEIDRKLTLNQVPTYTYEEALKKIQFGRRYKSLTKSAAEALLRRAIEPSSDGRYKFTLDQRMKNFINPARDFRFVLDTLEKDPVLCPVLIILGKDSLAQQSYMKPIIQYLKKKRNVSFTYVKGDHDVHNENPELVAPFIKEFLLKIKGKL